MGSTCVQASGEVVENSPKTSACRRIVQLDDAAVAALVAWQIAQDSERSAWDAAWVGSGYVFTYENGEPLRPQCVTRLFDALRRDVALPGMTLHGLRHMRASLLLASGADIALVSKLLGHERHLHAPDRRRPSACRGERFSARPARKCTTSAQPWHGGGYDRGSEPRDFRVIPSLYMVGMTGFEPATP